MVLKIKKRRRRKKARKEEGNLLINHQASLALQLSLPYTPFEKNKRKDNERKVSLSVPSSKVTNPRQWKTMVQWLWHCPRLENKWFYFGVAFS